MQSIDSNRVVGIRQKAEKLHRNFTRKIWAVRLFVLLVIPLPLFLLSPLIAICLSPVLLLVLEEKSNIIYRYLSNTRKGVCLFNQEIELCQEYQRELINYIETHYGLEYIHEHPPRSLKFSSIQRNVKRREVTKDFIPKVSGVTDYDLIQGPFVHWTNDAHENLLCELSFKRNNEKIYAKFWMSSLGMIIRDDERKSFYGA